MTVDGPYMSIIPSLTYLGAKALRASALRLDGNPPREHDGSHDNSMVKRVHHRASRPT